MPLLSSAVTTITKADIVTDLSTTTMFAGHLKGTKKKVSVQIHANEEGEIDKVFIGSSDLAEGHVEIPSVIKNIIPAMRKLENTVITESEATTAQAFTSLLETERRIKELYDLREAQMSVLIKNTPMNTEFKVNPIMTVSLKDKFADKHVAFKSTAFERFEIVRRLTLE